MNDATNMCLALTMEPERQLEFYALLQQGFNVQVQCGGTLEELLSNQWGIEPEYVTSRITTIFMNSKAIDSIPTTIIREGATLALSGAMPGLVGATMRRGGYYAAMRGSMTHNDNCTDSGSSRACIRVKLFNLLLPELGPGFLLRGIGLDAAQLAAFFGGRDAQFWQGCRSARLNGVSMGAENAVGSCGELSATARILLTVEFKE